MFQIISGKFFDSEERFHNDCKIVLYSNAHFCGKHNIGHVLIESTELHGDISTFVITYDNQLQILDTGFQAVKVGDEEIAYQIANLLSISLNCIWGKNKNQVEKLCSNITSNVRGAYTPSMFIPVTADLKHNISDDELSRADLFIRRVVGLSRKDYINVMQCIIAYNESIQHISTDVSLAYSMLVYGLESLAQKYDQYVATWDDYNQDIKAKLERVLQNTDTTIAKRIKEILIADGHFKLSQRFRNFVVSNVRDSFFEKCDGRYVISRDDLIVALTNAYNMRSQYAHMLEPIMKLLTDGSFSKTHDAVEFHHNVYFTYSGLLRLVKEIVDTFVCSCPQIEFEKIAWYYQLPGSIEAEAAPYFWIWKNDVPVGISSKAKFEGFIECLLFYKEHIPNMDTVLLQYMSSLSEMKPDNKAAAFSLCWLYYSIIKNIDEEEKSKLERLIEKNKEIASYCNIYSLTSLELISTLPVDINWDTQTVEKTVIEYRKKKYKNCNIKLPNLVELLLYYRLASLFQEDSNIEKRNDWLQIAYDASNNIPAIRKEISKLLIDDSAAVKNNLLLDMIYPKQKLNN